MRYIRGLFVCLFGVLLLLLCLSNQEVVRFKFIPSELDFFYQKGLIFEVPLFILLLIVTLAGVFLGIISEWFRGVKTRKKKKTKTLEKKALTGHPDSTNIHFLKESDDIINLLDKGKY
tara:strand:+ start:4946 stop:5299 length:354 start_codon:yes stop_codon:yes gene_type:complete